MRVSLKTFGTIFFLSVSTLAMGLPSKAAQPYSANQYLTFKRDLAGVLGEAHYIRTLCNGPKDQYWRNFMADFLIHEATSKSRKSLYTKAFNRGYKFQSNKITRCDSNAAILEVSLATKGRKMAESIATQYMN